ncbi:ATP-binding protein [Pelagibius sp. Alg239-R121]|uniref:ATP-binding protein n=1 Tax=Pelagibius sp. Alg239-R121 TaxID=2993448 RepID=UPI0024A76074|nr:ATP-binding protein [Pelagibius sp. Alg239-R121]
MKIPSVPKPDIRQRLWIALALLAASTLFVGGIAWYALDRADTSLEELHSQTLGEVARSLKLSKQSSDLATSAPFLLNLKSPYLIRREGRKLLQALEAVADDWPTDEFRSRTTVYAYEEEIAIAVLEMKTAVADLVEAAGQLSSERDQTIALNARLSDLENAIYRGSINPEGSAAERRAWLSLQVIVKELVGAGKAGNLLGVGEHRRKYQAERARFEDYAAEGPHWGIVENLDKMAAGPSGIFYVRRRELSYNRASQNALFRIRYNASTIGELAAKFAASAEEFLSRERSKTTTSIKFAKVVVLAAVIASVVLALISSIFVSGYVTGNIKAISDAMMRLAGGDRETHLKKKPTANDEIGKLLHSFRVFRANALRLDRTNRQLHQKNALFEKIFANITDGIAITNDAGQLTAANPNFARVLKLDDESMALKSSVSDALAKSSYAAEAKETGLDADFNGFAEIHSASGQYLEIRCSRLPDGGGIWLFSDATERRKIDERLRQIQRIESLGKVTGEVAHDFGNILSTISSNLHLMENTKPDQTPNALVQRISNAVEIGISLTQRLLAFARKQRLEPEITELNTLVEGLTDLVGIGLKHSVALETAFAPRELFVRVDPGQLESAILNLCLNSNQAIEGHGEIRISIFALSDSTAAIEVKDTGAGMDEDTITHALEPFFSARSDGQGTGLGLSMVYGFIKQTGGDIQIESEVGKGTAVRLILPLQADTAVGSSSTHTPIKKVLLVEDEADALTHASTQLQELGLSVVEARTYASACHALEEHQGFDALITDLQLDDGNTGWSLAERVLRERKGMHVIIASGRLPRRHPLALEFSDRLTCIPKPVSFETLSTALTRQPFHEGKDQP